jgi:hypothetical protein
MPPFPLHPFRVSVIAGFRRQPLRREHDEEKWEPVFQKNPAQTKKIWIVIVSL